mgnify:FL=1|jgi:hypothetical protein
MSGNNRQELIDNIYQYYENHDNYKAYLKCAYNKYQFEKYGLTNKNNIKDEDYIINDNNLRITINNIMNKVQISKDDFDSIINRLTYKQLAYIGI